MLYIVLLFLIVFTLVALYITNDILSPTVIISLTTVFGTFIACLGNCNWGISVPAEILLVYILGMSSYLFGELASINKNAAINVRIGSVKIFSAKRVLSENRIPYKHILIVFLYSSIIAYIYGKKAVQIAYQYGYTGAAWQSMYDYIKNAFMYKGAHMGILLSTAYALSGVFTYVSLQFFIVNAAIIGIKKTIKECWYYLLLLIPYAYTQFIQGQRTGYIGIFSFLIFNFLLAKNKISQKKIRLSQLIKYGMMAVSVFFVIFVSSGVNTGRLEQSYAFESLKVYAGSAIVDFAEYFNVDGRLNTGIGISTFAGLRGTLSRFIKLDGKGRLGFVTFRNGSMSNVYGAFASYYTDFWYFGVVLLPFALGYLYRRFYNNARGKNASYVSLYIYGYFSYGMVMSFISEQQYRLFFSVGQLMHLSIAYIVLRYCIKKYVYGKEKKQVSNGN